MIFLVIFELGYEKKRSQSRIKVGASDAAALSLFLK